MIKSLMTIGIVALTTVVIFSSYFISKDLKKEENLKFAKENNCKEHINDLETFFICENILAKKYLSEISTISKDSIEHIEISSYNYISNSLLDGDKTLTSNVIKVFNKDGTKTMELLKVDNESNLMDIKRDLLGFGFIIKE